MFDNEAYEDLPQAPLPPVREGQRWIFHAGGDGPRTDYVVERVWKHRARMFANHGNFTEHATVIIARMTPTDWTCLDA